MGRRSVWNDAGFQLQCANASERSLDRRGANEAYSPAGNAGRSAADGYACADKASAVRLAGSAFALLQREWFGCTAASTEGEAQTEVCTTPSLAFCKC